MSTEPTPRLLVVMGSGETSPTMVATHRTTFDRLGPGPTAATLIDTPFGFQENADDLTERVLGYFQRSLGRQMSVARLRRAELPALDRERALARLREARLVFSGPGSPTYALRQWKALAPVVGLLTDKLRTGGAIVFASAAAVTLGRFAVPVYEIYKVGEDPSWLEGLDLLAELEMSVAVLPHFNNTEGGTHDTRYCYLGERRLVALEEDLPEGSFVLGVDEHTACLFDLDRRSATVTGLGGVTVRCRSRATVFPTGSTVPIANLLAAARGSSRGVRPTSSTAADEDDSAGPALAADGRTSPLPVESARLGAAFDQALSEDDPAAAAGALLELAELVFAWSADSLQSEDLEGARSLLAADLLRLGEWAGAGVRDLRPVIGPYVEALVELRTALRSERRFETADTLRRQLSTLGVELQDTPEGTLWELRAVPGGE
ncbi:MAG: hypothetical protein ACRDV9_10920 [Acidimicrobiia bacterium]